MFTSKTYADRREKLKQQIESGLILFLGNNESPMNFPNNHYLFRQDSSFLYFYGLDSPGLAATIDVDENKEVIYGNDLTVDEVVWFGPQLKLAEKATQAGLMDSRPFNELEVIIKRAQQKGRKIHFLPQYRSDNTLFLGEILGVQLAQINQSVSRELVKAVINQRSVKCTDEIEQIEAALDITYEMQTYAMRNAKPGMVEREISGAMKGIALSMGGQLAFPIIYTVHGETLHNFNHSNVMQAGDLAVNDCGASSGTHYASDITRTCPVSGRFTEKQEYIYRIVLNALELGISLAKPKAKYMDVHLSACGVIATGLQDLGVMKGDTMEAVAAGAHALFFPHGLGHLMGLDVHEMESLGEDLVGYDEETQRSDQFGLCYLRLGKKLQTGYVLTVEPGIYFIPELIDMWKAEKRHAQFINYDEVDKYREFRGIRLEENVVIQKDGARILGKPIPNAIDEVENLASGYHRRRPTDAV